MSQAHQSQSQINVFRILVTVLIVGVLIRIFVIDSFIVTGLSMTPTLQPGDYVFVNKLAYTFGNSPSRGDMVVGEFREVDDTKVVKRIQGLPREWVGVTNGVVEIRKTRDGDPVAVATLQNSTAEGDSEAYRLDPFEYYIVGSNSQQSVDSRTFGPVDVYNIDGKVVFALRLEGLKIIKI